MIPIVILQEFPRQDDLGRPDPAKIVEMAAGLAHDLQDLVRGFAAVIVQQDVNFDAGAAAIGETLGELASQSAAFE